MITSRDAVLLAISVDSVASHKGFAESLKAKYRLLSDPELHAVDAYGVRFEIKGMTLAGRAIFVVDKRGKLALAERKFGVPKTLAGTPIPATLDRLLTADLDRAVAHDDPQREAKLTAIRTLSDVQRRDWTSVKGRLVPGVVESAEELAGPLMKLGDPLPSVFDLIDMAGLVVQSDKEGLVEVSAPARLEGMTRIGVSLKRIDKTWKVLGISVVAR